MKYLILLFVFTIVYSHTLKAQSLAINTDGSIANASAILDIKSTNKGVLLPRLSKPQKNSITTPAVGLIIYQTGPDSIGLHYYSGSNWLWIDATNTSGWKITGNAATDTAVNFIGTTDNMPIRFKQNNGWVGQLNSNQKTYFIGSGAGQKITSGTRNVAFGDSTLKNVTTGSNNTAVGNNANVLASATTNSSAIGANAFVTANNSLVLGSISGVNNSTADVNVGIGITAPTQKLHVVSPVAIRNAGYFESNNATQVQLEGSTIFARNVITGDNNVGAVNGNVRFTNKGFGVGGYFQGGQTGVFAFVNDDNPGPVNNVGVYGIYSSTSQSNLGVGYGNFSVASNSSINYGVHGLGFGNVGLFNYGVYGTATQATTANYGVYGNTLIAEGYAGYFNGSVFTTGTYQTSDENLKENFSATENSLPKILSLQVKQYEYNQKIAVEKSINLPTTIQTGFTAQQMQTVFPELTTTIKHPIFKQKKDVHNNDMQEQNGVYNFLGVNYTGLIPHLTKAIQEQQQIISDLQHEIRLINKKLDDLKQNN